MKKEQFQRFLWTCLSSPCLAIPQRAPCCWGIRGKKVLFFRKCDWNLYTHTIHGAAIYGNMDPIKISPMLAYTSTMDPKGCSKRMQNSVTNKPGYHEKTWTYIIYHLSIKCSEFFRCYDSWGCCILNINLVCSFDCFSPTIIVRMQVIQWKRRRNKSWRQHPNWIIFFRGIETTNQYN